MILDCSTCPARARACDDCVVAVILSSASMGGDGQADVIALDRDERRVVTALLSAGMITTAEAATARSRVAREPAFGHSVAG